ncbi:MAG: hypothetical protein AAB699_03390 [Patescibacteria group bacterium]
MKTTIPFVRYLLLVWLIASVVAIMAIPFVSSESLAGILEAFRSMQRIFFLGFLITLGVYCVWNTNRFSDRQRSRDECRKAYEALYRYFSDHALDGAGTELCRQLQETLDAELNRHCWFYKEYNHADIRRYQEYLRRMRGISAVY